MLQKPHTTLRSPMVRRCGARNARILVALAMVGVLGAACSGSPAGVGPAVKTGGRLVWAKTVEADLLDPAVSATAASWELLTLTYEGLVGVDDNLKLVPRLAVSWEQTSPKTYVFNLRKGVKFSNGREMNVDDVVGSLKRVMDPKTASVWAAQLGIDKAEAGEGAQVKITLAKPRTSFLAALAGVPAVILPMKELNAGTFDPKKAVLGTGPFKVADHSQGESWSLERNPHYWRPGVPKVNQLAARIMPDDAARVAALRAGNVDVTTFERPDAIRLLKGQSGVKTAVQATTDYYTLLVNARSSIFRDSRLREALSLTIDREKIRNVALGGVGRPTAGVPAAFNGVCDPAAVPLARPDVARARELVTAAGAAGKTVEIVTVSSIPMASPIAQVIQENLQAAGLKVRIVQADPGEAVERGKKGTFDLRITWFAGYVDPAMVLPWWNPEIALFNKAWAKPDTELNALIDTSVSTAPGPERAQAMRDACNHIAQDANMIPLVSKDTVVAYRSDKASVVIPKLEGYAVPLRRMAEFGVR